MCTDTLVCAPHTDRSVGATHGGMLDVTQTLLSVPHDMCRCHTWWQARCGTDTLVCAHTRYSTLITALSKRSGNLISLTPSFVRLTTTIDRAAGRYAPSGAEISSVSP